MDLDDYNKTPHSTLSRKAPKSGEDRVGDRPKSVLVALLVEHEGE